MFKIGNIKINGNVVLAPMAGISNAAYIKICESMGLSYAVTELISSEAVVRNSKKTFDMLNGLDDINIPIGIQIFGSDPDVMASAAKILYDKYSFISFIDINMGCPVPKVVNSGAGSSLLKDVDKIYKIVNAIKCAVPIPVTVKIRSGWDKNSINAVEVSKACEKAGASLIAIHARTRSEKYDGHSNWNIIKEVKKHVSIPVIGNGDIKNVYDAKKMIDETSCDAVMVGRALMGNPWLIRNINGYLDNGKEPIEVSKKEKIDMIIKHLDLLIKYSNEKSAVIEMRTHISWYLKGMEGSSNIKTQIFKATTRNEIIKILEYFSNI